MSKKQATFDQLSDRLATSGLRILHSGRPTETWPGPGTTAKSILIIGHAGSEFWPFFKTSPELSDGMPDPLDRWSKRIIQAAAPDLTFASPNDGPPFPPIHALAQGGALHPSPLGMLGHAEFGLWIAVRGLLISDQDFPKTPGQSEPDATHFERCFEACPVSAFSDQGYDAVACATHLIENPEGPCWSGCLARRACTLGQDKTYAADHARFYMDAFTRAMQRHGL